MIKAKKNIYKTTGMTVEQIIETDFEDIDAHIAKKVGHKITGYIIDERFASSEQVYSERERFLLMDRVDKELEKNDRRKSAFVKKSVSIQLSRFWPI